MRILCDCDGVLADFVNGVLTGLGTGRHESKITDYEMLGLLTPPERACFAAVVNAPGFCYGLEAYEGARETLDRLRSKHEVRIVTAPMSTSRTWIPERLAWLNDKMGVPPEHVIFASKAEKPYIMGDMLIEDHGKTLDAWVRNQPIPDWRASDFVPKPEGPKGILIGRPWNQEYHMRYNFKALGV